jgi:phospholipid/cholesterol/gamma-HCH transport system permease protein
LNTLRLASQLGIFLYLSLKSVWEHRQLGRRDFVRQVLMQVYFTGVQASGTVAILGVGVGLVAIVGAASDLGALSGAESLGRTVTQVILREVAPLLTGGIVIVRSITAIAAELGTMRVRREIEALEVMGIPPLRQLVAPRILGGMLSLFGLNVLFGTAALLGGYVGAQIFTPVPARLFVGAALSATTPSDLVAFLIKVVPGSVGIFLIGCYHGMNVGTSATEVPVAVSRAALHSLVFLVLLQAAVSLTVLLMNFRGAVGLLGGLS